MLKDFDATPLTFTTVDMTDKGGVEPLPVIDGEPLEGARIIGDWVMDVYGVIIEQMLEMSPEDVVELVKQRTGEFAQRAGEFNEVTMEWM